MLHNWERPKTVLGSLRPCWWKEVTQKLKMFSVVVSEALLRFAYSPECLSGQDALENPLEDDALWDCALAEAEELGAMAIFFDKVLTLLY